MNILKRLFLGAFFLIQISYPIPPLDPSHYKKDADSFIATHLMDSNQKFIVPAHDLQIILNLIYFSYLRSYCTLEGQEIALKTLQETWHGWQHIAQTRMNPSHIPHYQISLKKQKELFQEFLALEHNYIKTSSTYAQITQETIHESLLEHKQSLSAVKALRNHARTIVAQSFLDVKKILAELFNFAQNHLTKDLHNCDEESVSRFDLMSLLWNYIPHAGMKTFIETEKMYTKASEETWNILYTIQSVSTQLWDAIEQERASYYLAHYVSLYTLMNSYFPEHLFIMYEENQPLPDLSKTC